MNGMMLSSTGLAGFGTIIYMVVIFGALYFFMLRPQRKAETSRACNTNLSHIVRYHVNVPT